MTDKNGDDDQDHIPGRVWMSSTFSIRIERAGQMLAQAKLDLQKAAENQGHDERVEQSREEHERLLAKIKAIQKQLDNYVQHEPAPPPKQLSPPKQSSPPASATFLLALIAPKNSAQAQLGDLEEMFHKNAARFGEGRARRLYWLQVASSMGPLVWQWLKRIGFITLVIDFVRSRF